MAEPLPSKKPGSEETLQFLKREEVRTMAKDVALLREQEAEKERERISKIKTEEPKKESTILPKRPEPQPVPSLMPHEEKRKLAPRARTRFEKILIRLVVAGVLIFILFNGIAFGYWYFTKKRAVEITPNPQLIEPEGSSEPERPSPTPSPVVFFEEPQEKTFDMAATDNLLLLLSASLKEEHPQGFTKILFKEIENNAFLTTRTFLNKATLAVPEPLLSLLKEDFILFLFSSPGKKRLGFVGELSNTEGVQDILKNWEPTMEQDTKQLWDIVGQKGSAYVPFFRETYYQNTPVRFQTFSVIDFGIVYALLDSNLILTTSFESMTAVVDQVMQKR